METLLNLAAGAISGVVADVLTHPLSTVKTRLQVEGAQATFSAASAAHGAKLAAASGRPNPVVMLHRIWATEGMVALFRGVGIVVAGASPRLISNLVTVSIKVSCIIPQNDSRCAGASAVLQWL
jgi:hypothetical protein